MQVRAVLIAIGVLLMILWVPYIPWQRVVHGENDFLSLYEGARLAGTAELYSATAHLRIQQSLSSMRIPSLLYSRPPFYAVLLWPLGRLDYPVAYWLFQSLSASACMAFFWLLRRDRQLLWLAPMSIPLLATLTNGQDTMLLTLALAGSVLLERQNRPLPGGLLLSFCLIKFHFFVFVPLALISAKKWRMLAGGALGTVIWLAVSTLAQGTEWPSEYFHFLQQPVLHPAPFGFPNLRGLVGESHAMLGVLGIAVAAALSVLAWKRIRFETLLAMCLIGGFLVGYHAAIQDCCILFVAFHLLRGFPVGRIALFALLTPPAYYLLLMDGPASRLFAMTLLGTFLATALFQFRRSAPATQQDIPRFTVPPAPAR